MSLKFLAMLTIIIGCILITRKKILLKGEHHHMATTVIILVPIVKMLNEVLLNNAIYIIPMVLFSAIVIVPFIIYIFKRERNTYYIHNSNIRMVLPIITNILTEKNLAYEERETSILLKDDDSIIYYKKPLDTVILDFKEIKDSSLQEEIMEELKSRIQEIELKVFPLSGLLFIGLGIIFFLTGTYI